MNVFEFILSNKKNGQFTNYGSLTSWIGCDNPRHVADYFIEIDKYFIENDIATSQSNEDNEVESH